MHVSRLCTKFAVPLFTSKDHRNDRMENTILSFDKIRQLISDLSIYLKVTEFLIYFSSKFQTKAYREIRIFKVLNSKSKILS